MDFKLPTYRNSTPLANLGGADIYISDMMYAAVLGRLNTFLVGDTGRGKTQLVEDVMSYFGDKSLFLLGRNDMDTRELFRRINLGRLYSKPSYNPEPLVDPRTGKIEWLYSHYDKDSQSIVPVKLTGEQAARVRKTLDTLVGTTQDITEVTDNVDINFFGVDELPNCVPAVRAQLFNLFDGYIEISGRTYALGNRMLAIYPDGKTAAIPSGADTASIDRLREQGAQIISDAYSIGMATGNLGQQFTESSNELGRALRDRMHLIIDTDFFMPQPRDTVDILEASRNPRVNIGNNSRDATDTLRSASKQLYAQEVPWEKYIIAAYLVHGLDWMPDQYGGSKIALKSLWPNIIEGHETGSDLPLLLPVSPRAAKSIITLSQALDTIAQEKGVVQDYRLHIESMLTAFKFVSAYSGILNPALVRQQYHENPYAAMDGVIENTRGQIEQMKEPIAEGIGMVSDGRISQLLLRKFSERWSFMGDIFNALIELQNKEKEMR